MSGDSVVRMAQGSRADWGHYDSSPKKTGALKLRMNPHLIAIEKARRNRDL